RHTRLQGDWSSDVCSSDLAVVLSMPRLCSRRSSATATGCTTLPSLNRISARNSPALDHAAQHTPAILQRLLQPHPNLIHSNAGLAWERYLQHSAANHKPLSRSQIGRVQTHGRYILAHHTRFEIKFGQRLAVDEQYLPLATHPSVDAAIKPSICHRNGLINSLHRLAALLCNEQVGYVGHFALILPN